MKRGERVPPLPADAVLLRQTVVWGPPGKTTVDSQDQGRSTPPGASLSVHRSATASRSATSLVLDSLSTQMTPLPSIPSIPSSPVSPVSIAADASASRVSLALPGATPPSRLLSDEQRRAVKTRHRHSSHVRAVSDIPPRSRRHQMQKRDMRVDVPPLSPDPAFGTLLGLSPTLGSTPTMQSSPSVPSRTSAAPARTLAHLSSAAALAAAVQNGNASSVSLLGKDAAPRQEPLRACSAVHARLQRAALRKERERPGMASTPSLSYRAAASADNVNRDRNKQKTPSNQNVSYKCTAYYAEITDIPQRQWRAKTKSRVYGSQSQSFNATTTTVNEYESKREDAPITTERGRVRNVAGKSDSRPKLMAWVRSTLFGDKNALRQ